MSEKGVLTLFFANLYYILNADMKRAPYSQYVLGQGPFFRPWLSFFCHSRMFLSGIQTLVFLLNCIGPICPIPLARAQQFPSTDGREFRLPAPGVMVRLSPPLEPPVLKGIKVHPDNPFRFDFILDKGDMPARGHLQDRTAKNVSPRSSYRTLADARRLPSEVGLNAKATQRNEADDEQELRTEANKLIKYFLASLTIPEKDLWVNLSPYEKDRIIPKSFGLTEMGRDLLAEDYMLKQITASLIYPEDEIGKKFWKRVYEEAAKKYGTTNIPVNTFNKVWIVPEKAVVYENAQAGTAYVVESKLKVMLEQDYLAMSKHADVGVTEGGLRPLRALGSEGASPASAGFSEHAGETRGQAPNINSLKVSQVNNGSTSESVNAIGSQIVREIVIPELTKEVNEGKNFAQLRQVYNSLILATWYKKKIKDSILAQVYDDKNKIQGLSPTRGQIPNKTTRNASPSRRNEPNDVEFIYQRYLQAFKRGVFNYIKEESDPMIQETIPRKYFSGGVNFAMGATTMKGIYRVVEATKIITKALREIINTFIPGKLVEVEGDFNPSEAFLPVSPVNVPEGYSLIGGGNNIQLAKRLQRTTGLTAALLGHKVYSPFQDNGLTLEFMDIISSYIKQWDPRTIKNNMFKVLVIGSGSGLDVMTAFHQAKRRGFQVNIDAVDVEDESIDNTQKNFELLKNEITAKDSVHIFKVPGDGQLNDLRDQYDLILFYAPDAVPKKGLGGGDVAISMDQDIFKKILQVIADRLLAQRGVAIIGNQKEIRTTLVPGSLGWNIIAGPDGRSRELTRAGVFLGGQKNNRVFFEMFLKNGDSSQLAKDRAMKAGDDETILVPGQQGAQFITQNYDKWEGIFDVWMKELDKSAQVTSNPIFFIGGQSGAGKTFLSKKFQEFLRNKGKDVVNISSNRLLDSITFKEMIFEYYHFPYIYFRTLFSWQRDFDRLNRFIRENERAVRLVENIVSGKRPLRIALPGHEEQVINKNTIILIEGSLSKNMFPSLSAASSVYLDIALSLEEANILRRSRQKGMSLLKRYLEERINISKMLHDLVGSRSEEYRYIIFKTEGNESPFIMYKRIVPTEAKEAGQETANQAMKAESKDDAIASTLKGATVISIAKSRILHRLERLGKGTKQLGQLIRRDYLRWGFILENPFLNNNVFWNRADLGDNLSHIQNKRGINKVYFEQFKTHIPAIYNFSRWILNQPKYRGKKIIVLGKSADPIYDALTVLTHIEGPYVHRQNDVVLIDFSGTLLNKHLEDIDIYGDYFRTQLRQLGVNEDFDNVVFVNEVSHAGNMTSRFLRYFIGGRFDLISGFKWNDYDTKQGISYDGKVNGWEWADWLDTQYNSGRHYSIKIKGKSASHEYDVNDLTQRWLNQEAVYLGAIENQYVQKAWDKNSFQLVEWKDFENEFRMEYPLLPPEEQKRLSAIETQVQGYFGEIDHMIKRNEIYPNVHVNNKGKVWSQAVIKRPMRIGIFPLTGNPPTWGHITLMLKTIIDLRLDKIIIISQGIPTQDKPGLLEEKHRYAMLKLLAGKLSPLVEFSEIGSNSSVSSEENALRLLGQNNNLPIDSVYIAGDEYLNVIPGRFDDLFTKYKLSPRHHFQIAFAHRFLSEQQLTERIAQLTQLRNYPFEIRNIVSPMPGISSGIVRFDIYHKSLPNSIRRYIWQEGLFGVPKTSNFVQLGRKVKVSAIQGPKNPAMAAHLKGGIDLSRTNMNLKTRNAGTSIKFHLDPAQLQRLQNATGFVPVIISIKPLVDLQGFLGVQNDSAPRTSASV